MNFDDDDFDSNYICGLEDCDGSCEDYNAAFDYSLCEPRVPDVYKGYVKLSDL